MVFENEKAIYNGLDGTQITNSTHTFSVEDLCAVSLERVAILKLYVTCVVCHEQMCIQLNVAEPT